MAVHVHSPIRYMLPDLSKDKVSLPIVAVGFMIYKQAHDLYSVAKHSR